MINTKIKKLILGIVITFFTMTSAMALDIIIPSAAGGTYHKFATIMADGLKEKGVDVKLIVAGNCVLGKQKWNDATKNSIFLNSEATNAVAECNVPITTDNHAFTYFTAGWVIISHSDGLGERMGVVGYMKQTVKDLNVKLIPYKNTRSIKAAFIAGEIDSGFVIQAIAYGLKEGNVLIDTMEKDKGNFKNWVNNDLTLNYYIMKTPDVDDEVIEIIRNISKFKLIAEKKKMVPVTHGNHADHVKYLLTNEEKWK